MAAVGSSPQTMEACVPSKLLGILRKSGFSRREPSFSPEHLLVPLCPSSQGQRKQPDLWRQLQDKPTIVCMLARETTGFSTLGPPLRYSTCFLHSRENLQDQHSLTLLPPKGQLPQPLLDRQSPSVSEFPTPGSSRPLTDVDSPV